MKRRDFLKSTAAVAGGGLASGLGLGRMAAQSSTETGSVGGPRPNILFILVDELRYPSAFPAGIHNAGDFFRAFMPNLHRLWYNGVKFGNYHTAANACTPARGVIISGLYSQQNWLITTIVAPPNPNPILLRQPVLNPAYPTYGKLLRQFGYHTPYRGKWHVSIPQKDNGGLENYGFDYDTYPDPTGANLQGTYGDEKRGFHNDAYTADQAVDFLCQHGKQTEPWCLTVGFVNPHDREFFPFGTEFQTFNNLFTNHKTNPDKLAPFTVYPGSGPVVSWEADKLKSPPPFDYPELPPNWETSEDWVDQKKPSTQAFIKEFSEAVWGGIAENRSQEDYTVVPYGDGSIGLGVPKAPFSYWKRGMDSYTQIMQVVDCQIGRVIDALHALPKSVVDNTVIVFASDHGEYSGAHGLPQGKLATVYEEAWHIPLVVVDPSGRFTNHEHITRNGLTSSVDLLNMLVTIGNKGSTDWMTGDLARIYGQRHDMYSMLKSPYASGRSYILHATDEIAPDYYNFNHAPTHVLALRTEDYKFGISADWFKLTSRIDPSSKELEFYNYATERGRLELDNTPHDSRATAAYNALIHDIIPHDLQQNLPPSLRGQQIISKARHLAYRKIVESLDSQTLKKGGARDILGYGGVF